MFLVSFASFIRLFTSFLRFKRGLVFFSLLLGLGVLMWLFALLFKNKKLILLGRKFLLSRIPAFLLATWSVGFALWNYDPAMLSAFFSFWNLEITSPEKPFQPFLAEVQVKEQSKPDTYLVETSEGKQYFLKTKTSHQPGTKLQLGGSLKAVDLSKCYAELAFQSGSGFSEFFSYQFNYDKRLLMRGIHGTLYEQFSFPRSPESPSAWRSDWILKTRNRLRAAVSSTFPEKPWALLLGMLIGDKSQLSKADYQGFVESGIVHIIAVSGGNLVMIVIFLGAVLFFLPFYLRNAVILLGVVAFALLCGGDSSVVRALIMAVLSLLALFRGREIPIWRLLKLAFLLMLCYNPFFLSYDLGFLLSFGAVIGIVLVSEAWTTIQSTFSGGWKKKKVRLPFISSFLKNYGLPTLGATLGTLPVLLFFIGETNLSGVLINLFIVPLVPIITIGGFVSVLLVVWTGWSALSLPITWLLELVFRVSSLAQKWSFALVLTETWAKWAFSFLMIAIGLVGYFLLRKQRRTE